MLLATSSEPVESAMRERLEADSREDTFMLGCKSLEGGSLQDAVACRDSGDSAAGDHKSGPSGIGRGGGGRRAAGQP